MTDHVSSDNPAVRTVDATLDRQGRTRRPRVTLPEDARDALPVGEVVRLVVDGTEYRTRAGESATDTVELRGAYDTPAAARDPGDAPNRLAEWVERTDLSFGRTVHLDVVEDGFKYGLRAPGETVVYEATERPDEGLASIARDLEE